ncbi:hypothetical protein BU25DRAFT_437809 [Macroventuria anomochaeta]|uniref:Uncharacterized protein n=1 Tax=Macroventuria anomochaeta TaxID=301207 RepID=A0ACB6SBH0_9PLEO|nr:uncharacterized protein BU25DRAFT_437809 [Macroventuria anomochaeta]KAF2631318.1 hypothetical protein BU25DRAFT_437809 [Macroventuria anomochaeta]
MNRLKSKASRFFKDGPSQDEKAANAPPSHEADFDAGIESGLRSKPSRFFRKQSDKPLPAPPSDGPSIQAPPPISKDDIGEREDVAVENALGSTSLETDKPLPSRSVSTEVIGLKAPVVESEELHAAVRKAKPADLVLKKRPSFVSLRKSSSRIFRTHIGDHDRPPPPMPQIPIDTPTPKSRRPTLRPLESVRSARSSRSSSGRIVSISRPVSSTQVSQLPATLKPSKVPFTKPSGPPPARPPRPESLDDELTTLVRDGSARMILHTPNRTRTLTVSTSSSARSRALTRVGSEEACTRLGLPSGHSSLSSPKSPIFDSPLAANFPLDPNRPLPFRDSSGSVKGYGRSSTYIKARQQYSSSGYTDGVEQDDRELGPIEQYRESKCGDWTLERRVSGKLGERGMLFRDRWGGWHFVADI